MCPLLTLLCAGDLDARAQSEALSSSFGYQPRGLGCVPPLGKCRPSAAPALLFSSPLSAVPALYTETGVAASFPRVLPFHWSRRLRACLAPFHSEGVQ